MRFLVNENFPLSSVKRLREAGFDVAAIVEDSPGAKDREILARAAREDRIILTFDRDYGELIYRKRHPAPAGVIYLCFDPSTPSEPGEFILQLINMKGAILQGRFSVLERSQLRQRPLLQTE